MDLSPKALLFACVVMICLVSQATACGSDDTSRSVEEYFDRLQSISEHADQRFQAIVGEISRDFDSEAEEIQAYRNFYSTDLQIFRDYNDDLAALRPPVEIADAHSRFVSEGTELSEVIALVTARMADVGTKAELAELLSTRTLDAATAEFDAACRQLQTIADSRHIAVDLDCE